MAVGVVSHVKLLHFNWAHVFSCVVYCEILFFFCRVLAPRGDVMSVVLFLFASFGLFTGLLVVFCGEFDPGSGRTLAACLTHASRTERPLLAVVLEWRTGE